MAISYHQKEGNVTVLGEETSFDGVLSFTDNLIITGKFTGTIKSETGSLVIEKTGKCEVDTMSADSIVIAGSVEGDSNATGKLEMLSGSQVKGDISSSVLRVADNVEFQGSVKMLEKVQDIDIFSVSASEYKKMVNAQAEVEEEYF